MGSKLLPWLLSLFLCCLSSTARSQWPVGIGSTRYYEFKVQTMKVTKLCQTKEIAVINGMYPGPVLYAQENDRVVVTVTNESPYNATIHWHGVRQRLSCWSDGPAYITQCPILPGGSFTYDFTLVKQRGTLLWHAHVSWLRATVHGALIIYPRSGVPYPFPRPYEEKILILGEYWLRDLVKLERQVLSSGGGAPPANAYTINGHPGPRYNCSALDVMEMEVVPGRTYLLRVINAGLNTELFFSIAGHQMRIVEADADYTKPFTVDQLMLGPGQTTNVLVTADQPIGRYDIAAGPYMSARNVPFQTNPAIAYFQYTGASTNSLGLPAELPAFNDNLVVRRGLTGLRSLNPTDLPADIDRELFFTVGLNVDQCRSGNPAKNCQGTNNGVFTASMNNISFIRPTQISLLEAYYGEVTGQFTPDFPGVPLRIYDFVNGAPNNAPVDTQSAAGTKVVVLEFGERVQLVLQDTGTVTTENHPIHLHGYSFYVVGFGDGDYNPATAVLNLEDPPRMNTIAVPVGGWAVIRFVADNPGVWFMHCHVDIHLSWGLSMVFIVKNGEGPFETLPGPPPDLPKC